MRALKDCENKITTRKNYRKILLKFARFQSMQWKQESLANANVKRATAVHV